MLELTEHENVVFLRVPEPVRPGDAAALLAQELVEACRQVEERDVWPIGVVLTSAPSAFWIMPPSTAQECDAGTAVWADATRALARVGPPVVAVMDGDAIGRAWEIALACDLRLAAADVHVGSTEIRWGRIPAAGGTQRLVRLVGPAVALRLLLLGEVLPAAAALDLGLLHRVAPGTGLADCLAELLGGLRASAPIALAYAKETVIRAADLSLEDGLRLETDLAALLQTTQDRAEGIDAFLKRRAPRFEGR